jgi:Ca2+-binding RTX toxin-like protein
MTMPLSLTFTAPGDYTVDDDGIAGNNTSVIRDGTGAVIFTFAHPADDLSFAASTAGVNLTVDFTDPLGAGRFTLGSLTDPTASFASIALDNVRTTGAATLVSNGAIDESGADSGVDVVAAILSMSAVSGIGTAANRIETQASLFEAETTSGGIYVTNIGDVTFVSENPEVGGLSVADTGDIVFVNYGSVRLGDTVGTESVHGGATSGNVTLIANGYDSSISSTVDNDAVMAAGGDISLSAGQDIAFGTAGANYDNDVVASGAVTINAGRDVVLSGFADINSDGFGHDTGGDVVINAGRDISLLNSTGTDASIAALGGAGASVFLTTGAGGTLGLEPNQPTTIYSASGDVTVNADRILIDPLSGITASAGQVFLRTAMVGREIDLGGTGDADIEMQLSDVELDRVFTPTLTIGNGLAGQITVSAAISPASAQNLILRTGGDIAVQAAITTTGSLTLLAGDSVFMTSSPAIAVGGALSIFVDTFGNDGGIGGVAYFGTASVSATSIAINGAGENDTLGGFEGVDQTVHGNGGNDTITSSGEGHYFGEAGDDLMQAGLSSGLVPEALDGGSGVDTLDTRSFSAGDYTVNLATGATNFAFESFVNFENLITGDTNDQIIGTAGNNEIDGGGGNDVLNGGTGADTMRGGAGNDVYVVDNAGDVVDETAFGSDGIDRVVSSVRSINLSDAVHYRGAIEIALLSGSANLNLTGNALNNALTGNAGANVLNGMAGADVMRGMAGNDTYVRDHVNDIVDESIAGSSGFDTVQSVLAINLSDTVRFKGAVENAMLTGAANVNAFGNALANVLTGNAGVNTLNGMAGNDSLRGMDGNDRLYGSVGNDTLAGGTGNDVFVFNTALNNSANVDAITDFSAPNDTIWLDNAVFAALGATGALAASAFHLGAAATDTAHRILYDSSNGWLRYDADGSGASAAIHFATLTTHPAITSADFVVV